MNESLSQTPSNIEPTPSPALTPEKPVASQLPRPRSLRLWPAVVLLILQWLVMLVPAWVAPATTVHFWGGFFGPFVGTFALALWWLFFSGLSWTERLLGLVVFIATATVAAFLADESFDPVWLLLFALPVATTAVVVWLVVSPMLGWSIRRAGLVLAVVLSFGYFTLVRNGGVDGNFSADFPWRWSVSDEDRYLQERASKETTGEASSKNDKSVTLVLQEGDWPAFRGAERDGRRAGVHIATNWDEQPPKLLWKQRIGPGWASFAVVGGRLFTQEQRGADEVVVCYDANSGRELWAHKDEARFTEAMAGPGPRATPTFHEGKIYAQGATGKLNCLDAVSGKVVWSRDVAADTKATVPTWGYSASPLIMHGVVAVFASAEGKSMAGYDAQTGKFLWSAGNGQFSYCSPQPATIDGVAQFIMATDQGLTAYEPRTGKVLWENAWPLEGGMSRVVQPASVGDSDFLLGTGFGFGTRRVHVKHDADAWSSTEVWTSRAIKPYYNDLVIHKGHLYGFDHNFFTCVNLADGKSKWRARGYGNGQVLLLADQDLLVIQEEYGKIALVDATPEAHNERAIFQAIEGKTWNHPVVAHGKLFVRNGQEAACYELTRIE